MVKLFSVSSYLVVIETKTVVGFLVVVVVVVVVVDISVVLVVVNGVVVIGFEMSSVSVNCVDCLLDGFEIAIKAGRIGARIVDDNAYGRSVIKSKS